MDISLSPALHSVILQLRNTSHKLEIKIGRNACKPMEKHIWQLYHWVVESEEHYVCQCAVFYKIRKYHCISKQSFGPYTLWRGYSRPQPVDRCAYFNVIWRSMVLWAVFARSEHRQVIRITIWPLQLINRELLLIGNEVVQQQWPQYEEIATLLIL